jgi:hypothetical protein
VIEEELDNVEQVVFGSGVDVLVEGPQVVPLEAQKQFASRIGTERAGDKSGVHAVIAEVLLKEAPFRKLVISGQEETFQSGEVKTPAARAPAGSLGVIGSVHAVMILGQPNE